MQIKDLKDKKIGILGFGVEGKAVAEYLEQNGISYEIFDKTADPEYLSKIHNCEIVFRSPGVRYLFAQVQQAKQSGVVITSQIKYFFENCPAKIIGVTGTKGKGTTTQLIFEILKTAGLSVYAGGNLGNGVLNLLGKLKNDDYVVLELSSFQLQDLEQSPHIAVVLMITSEHLDYHSDTDEYVQAKSNITKYQRSGDFAVVNFDYENSMKIGDYGSAKKFYVQTVLDDSAPKIQNGIFASKYKETISFVEAGNLTEAVKIKDLLLPGFHNVQNVCAAMMASKLVGVDLKTIKSVIKEYRGLEHRLEFVAEVNGVKFYNDSIGTTPESTIAAIESFEQPEIIIIGGFDKKGDYDSMAKKIAAHLNVKAVVVIGDISQKLKNFLEAHGFKGKLMFGAQNMKEIFSQIRSAAKPGDVVLLAPGTSSFGMFKDYKERGNQFKEQVLKF